MTKRALLTGATGFIGRRLARRLVADGWTVHALVRDGSDLSGVPSSLQIHRLDGTFARLSAAVTQARPDLTFHLASLYLAGHTPEDIETLIRSNILLPAQIAQALVNAGAPRMINTGTASQHDRGGAYQPASLYAATKQACEDTLRYFHRSNGLSVVTLKIFDTYGPDDPRRKLIQLLVDAAVSGEHLGMSPGEQVLDLTHVDDIVEAFIVAAEHLSAADTPLFEDYFLSGERHSVRSLVTLVQSAIGRTIDVRFGARPYRAGEIMMPVEPAIDRRLPGWDPVRRLSASVPSMVARERDEQQKEI